MKFSAPVAIKAAEMAKMVAPVSDPSFPELFQLSYQWIWFWGEQRFLCTEACEGLHASN